MKFAIRCRFAPQGHLKAKALHSTFHILPGDCTATTVNRVPLGILINIYRRSLISGLRRINIGHTTKSATECTEFATVIIRLCPFPGPSQTFTPRLRPLQNVYTASSGFTTLFCPTVWIDFPAVCGISPVLFLSPTF